MEFVEQNREKLIDELECMESIGLFSADEIRKCARERTDLLYKLQKREKSTEDTLAFVNYEINLIKNISAIRKAKKILSNHAEIENNIIHRLHGILFKLAENTPRDIDLWMKYFEFCKNHNYMTQGRNNLETMLNHLTENENLYVFASRWEVECGQNEKAHLWLCKGLNQNPKSQLLNKEIMLAILNNLEKILTKRKAAANTGGDEPYAAEIAYWNKLLETSYDTIKKNIFSVDFYVDLYKSVLRNPHASRLKELLLQDFRTSFSHKEEAWDMLARYEMLPIDQVNSGTGEDNEDKTMPETNNFTVKGQIQKAIGVYEEAIKKIPTKRMWEFYLDWLEEICLTVLNFPIFTGKCLMSGFEAAEASGKLSQKHCIKYIKLLDEQKTKSKQLFSVLQFATSAFPQSAALWHYFLRYYVCKQSTTKVLEIFQRALDSLKEVPAAEIIPLYQLMINYFTIKDWNKCDELFLEGLKGRIDLARLLKPLYLDWKFTIQGISGARKVVELSDPVGPPILEVYKMMAEFEAMQTEPSLSKIRRWHENMVRDFGVDNVEVWLKFISFEVRMGDAPGRVPLIYERAKKTLSSNCLNLFLQRYDAVFEKPKENVVTCED